MGRVILTLYGTVAGLAIGAVGLALLASAKGGVGGLIGLGLVIWAGVILVAVVRQEGFKK